MRRTLLSLALAASLLAACGGTSDGSTSGTAGTPTTVAVGDTVNDTVNGTAAPTETGPAPSAGEPATTAAAEAPEALQFSAPLVGGGDIDFTQFAGRTVALWFWAPT
jgi:hypothetical protein